MKSNKVLITLGIVVVILALAVAYAAIDNQELTISGNVTTTASNDNFSVIFSGANEITVPDGVSASAEVNSANKQQATLEISGFTTKDQVVTVSYTIENTSEADVAALVSETTSISDNDADKEWFAIENKTLTPTTINSTGATTTATLQFDVRLLDTPISSEPTATVTSTIIARPTEQE